MIITGQFVLTSQLEWLMLLRFNRYTRSLKNECRLNKNHFQRSIDIVYRKALYDYNTKLV
ncbi:unnamed protein product, partial [Nesidiocoris tenuis]